MPNEKPASPTAIAKDEKPNSPTQDVNKQTEAPKPAEKKTFKAGIIDLQELTEAQARDIGDARMTEDKESRDGNRFTRFVKRIWKHNMAQEYYRQKEISKVRADIMRTGNLYEGEQVNGADSANIATQSKEAEKAIIDKFTSDYANEILREEEKDSKREGNEWVNNKIKDLIKNYASGGITEEQFKQQKQDTIELYNPNYAEKGKLYADNLFDIAKEVKDAVANGQALEQMDFEVKLTLGKARESLDTEAKKTTFDKILNSKIISKTMLGQALVQSGIIAGAYALTRYVLVDSTRKAAKWAGFGAGLGVSSVIEGYKEAARVERERSQHMRERAKGVKFTEEDMKRRQEMEKNRYDTRNATEIIGQLEHGLTLTNRGNLTESEMNTIMADLSDFESRVRTGGNKKADFILYDDGVEKGRTAMLEKAAELKKLLRLNNPNFDAELENQVSAKSEQLLTGENGVESRDKLFKKLKRNRVGIKMAQAVLIGGAMSFAIQEVYSLGTKEDGIIEGSVKSIRNHFDGTPGKGMAHDTTAMESLRRWIAGDGPRMPMGTGNNLVLENGTHIHLPQGAELVQNPDGHGYDLIAGDKVVSGIDFDSNGNLNPESIKALHSADVYFDANTVGTHTTETVTQTADEYMKQHPAGTTKVHFKDWMGNNTEMHPDPLNPGHRLGADLNEVRTQWIGNGVDENGDYAMTVSHMTNDGSFQGGLSVAAREQMAAGKLEAILSVTKEGQHNVFRIPINPDGTFKILHDSPEGQMLFSVDAKGHAQFDGAFLQIAHPDGVASDGQINEQILGALEGTENPHSVTDIVNNDTRAPDIRFSIPLGSEIEPPLPIPPIPRTPMERGSYAKKDTSKQGPAKDKGIEKVKDLQSKNPIEGAVDPLKTGAEDLTKNEKVPVTEADFDENIKNARAEEATVFAEFSEWEKNRKTPEEKPPQDLEDRYAAAQTKVANAEKAKAEFMARTDNEPAPAPASSEVNPTNPIVAPTPEGSENIEQKEKAKWIIVEDKEKGFGITNPDRDDYFYDKDGQTYWSKDRKVIRNLINKLNNGEEIESVSDLNKQPEEQILSDKDLETRYALDEEEQDLSDKLLSESRLKESADKAITDFTNKKTNKGKPIPQKLLDASSVAEMRLRNAQDAYNEFVSTREDLENGL